LEKFKIKIEISSKSSFKSPKFVILIKFLPHFFKKLLGSLPGKTRNRRGTLDGIAEFALPPATHRALLAAWAWFLFAFLIYVSGCQFYEPKSIPPEILANDQQKAFELTQNPEVVTPCLDASTFTSDCYAHVSYSVFFGVSALFFAFEAIKRTYHLAHSGASVMPSESDHQHGGANQTNAIAALKQKWKSAGLGVGGDNYWKKAVALLAFDILMQCIKCFGTGQHSYAKTSATFMVIQIILMVLDVILSMVMLYVSNTFGFVAVNECAEVGYIALRLAQTGGISMRCHDLLDFMTLATPFVLTMHEIGVMTKFIQKSAHKDGATEGMPKMRRSKAFSIIVSIIATIAGIVTIYSAHHKGSMECPVSGSGHWEVSDFLPTSVRCDKWNFDFYLDPPCSCMFVHLSPIYNVQAVLHLGSTGFSCAPFNEDPDHALLQPIMPYIQNARFVDFHGWPDVMSNICPLIKEDLQLIASFKQLRYLLEK